MKVRTEDWTDLVKPEWLARRVTLDQYFTEQVEWVAAGKNSQSAVDQDRAQLEARALPGDEWWEWILGTEPLRQIGGLALQRNGNVVWARDDWIS